MLSADPSHVPVVTLPPALDAALSVRTREILPLLRDWSTLR